MPEILIASCPPVGHIGPLLNVARGLVGRGDRVTVLTSARHADAIRAAGARPLPLPVGADFDDTALDAELPGRAETSGIARVNFDVKHVFVRPLPYQAAALSDALAGNTFDVILADAFFLGILPILLKHRPDRPPLLAYVTSPLLLTSRDTAPGGTGILPGTGRLGRLRNRALNVLAQRILLRPAHQSLIAMLDALGLPEPPAFVLDSGILADRVIVPTIPEFEYPRSDLPGHVCFVGAVTPAPASDFTPPAWWHRLDQGRPVVHVTQGTVDNADLSRLIEPTIAALADENVTLVVSTGGRPVDQIRTPLPANTVATEFVPHDMLLPRVDVMVTNGGYGAVQRALMAGVPLVVAGNTEDKPEVAARVEWFGAGVNLRSGTPSPTSIHRAVREVLSQHAYRRTAAELQQAYARRDGVAAIADVIDAVIAEWQVVSRHA
ncbi:glycosyltransferase family 1 protein [Mycolicibacterium fluoranthenivorans]|jgi:UDP:flavonoid glycosyltransferase YjiC (YdhE family)|uniref:Glycosyltransferase family 1 protein n=1 Tax=Mycolicibacterium fluoranthenivorans TaxID=258505 RepID=A0A7G8PBB0_9MYCO|nr:glycosyltransferase [Mycolicibacterium fluoranthenivorans]QNJ91626.1 glycosyltransferase family 1 protein [Mycolicibacterium fluoranthenivorans]